MRILVRYLRSRRVTLMFMRVCSVILGVLALYMFGSVFASMSTEMRITSVAAFMLVAYGYVNMYYGIKLRKTSMTTWGYIMTAIGIVLIEVGTLLLGGK